MDWQAVVRQDPYLAGSIAARSYEWWDTTALGPERTARSCGLQPGEDAYTRFLQGWNDELQDMGIDRAQRAYEEQQAMLRKAEERGDPEVW